MPRPTAPTSKPATASPGPAPSNSSAINSPKPCNGINYDLLQTPSANVLISDYGNTTALGGKTSASALPAGSCMLRCPLDAANAITCAEAMRRQLQWLGGIGSPVIWTDHSQTPPQLRIATRDQLTAKNLPLAGITIKNKIKKRADLIPPAVHFKYKVSGNFLGQPFSVVVNDVAAYIGGVLIEGIGPLGQYTDLSGNPISSGNQTALQAAAKTAAAIVQTFDFQGDQVSAQSCKITCQSITGALGGAGDQVWTRLFPDLKNVTNLGFPASGPLITITDYFNGTVYYQNGAWTGTQYTNIVQDGQVAPWMLASNNPANPIGGQTVKVRLSVRFSNTPKLSGAGGAYATTGGKTYDERNTTVTLTTLPSGTYYSAPQTAYGEPVPFGLAGYILALESIPQYEGSVLVQENEITDVCPLGNALNITGGLAEWAAMKACVQSVRYSDNGQTEITFGPAKHLGPAQFVARFRSNIGPRWFNLIPADPMNQSTGSGGNSLGNNIPVTDASPGAQNFGFMQLLTSPSTQMTASGNAATLPAGLHLDTGAYGNQFTGAQGANSRPFGPGQQIVIAEGPSGSNPGEAMGWIRLSIADMNNQYGLPQHFQVYLRELQTCENISGVPTSMYRVFLCSQAYATSLGI